MISMNRQGDPMKTLTGIVTAMALAMALGCSKKEDEGPAERAGKQMDEAVEETKDYTSEKMDEAGDAMEEAGDYTSEKMDEAREYTGEKMEDMGDAMEDAGEKMQE
jgi:hypothetical protein